MISYIYEHTSRSRDRTADITASCIDGNITVLSMVSVAVVPDGLTRLLVMFAEKQQIESKLRLKTRTVHENCLRVKTVKNPRRGL